MDATGSLNRELVTVQTPEQAAATVEEIVQELTKNRIMYDPPESEKKVMVQVISLRINSNVVGTTSSRGRRCRSYERIAKDYEDEGFRRLAGDVS